ncbi:S26 family signal peptidase [Deinococcus multiflagellatus]|uniref:S26 family signal peptidase n=1 Tax=Deinococcus multiflagellatus TaxID=1656887 RepID=A0ABW1ZR64_9DEIO
MAGGGKSRGLGAPAGRGGYARGDIVVFKPPRGAEAAWSQIYRGMPLPWRYRPFLVKRVIGLPGTG